jgi:hypothetical protein
MKKYLIGVLAVTLALGGSAFTKFGPKAAGDVYGELVAGHYQRLNNPYNAANCQNLTSNPCAYVVTAAGAANVTLPSYGTAAMATFLANGWVTIKDNNTGLYTGN